MFTSEIGCFFSASDLAFYQLSHAFSWTRDLICKRNAQSQDHSYCFHLIPLSAIFFFSLCDTCHIFLSFPASHIVSAVCSSYTNISKLLGYLSPLCWISTTERKAFSQQAITIKHSRIAAEQETSLKLENWGLVGKFASYCMCNFQLTILCCIYKNYWISSKPKQKL